MSLIVEGSVKIEGTISDGDVNRKMEVFYNPIMDSNRNISILLLNCVANKKMRVADILAGSGIRSLRFLKELKKGKIEEVCVNDLKPNFENTFLDNLRLNKLSDKMVKIFNQDATIFLFNSQGFDYIEVDPFGSPNPFLSAAIAKISREGILAITATDTAALTGTYPRVTQRKYWAKSMRNYLMHEIGLRILIRKVQLQGVQFDKALVPILSYHKEHYFRIYFKCIKGKEKCDQLLREHQYFLFCNKCLNFKTSCFNESKCACGAEFEYAGPLWIGKLFNAKLIAKMAKENKFIEEQKFLDILKEESTRDLVGFYDLHVLAKKFKQDPQKKEVLANLGAVSTHFSPTGFKTEKEIKEIVSMLSKKKE